MDESDDRRKTTHNKKMSKTEAKSCASVAVWQQRRCKRPLNHFNRTFFLIFF